jgi:phthalate 4,5-cis-dihydrodiol dehydrogenase
MRLNYTDYLYRPRRPEELDTSKGGGAIFNQAAHQVDMARLVAGTPVQSVRAVTGSWDVTRPTEGAYATLLHSQMAPSHRWFTAATAVSIQTSSRAGSARWARRRLPTAAQSRPQFKTQGEETAYKRARNYGGADFRPPGEAAAHQHFGTLLVSCERADLRPVPNGVMIYQNGSSRLDAIPSPGVPRAEVIDELYQAVAHGKAPLHDGAWGQATVEVLLAMLQSARDGRDIRLK